MPVCIGGALMNHTTFTLNIKIKNVYGVERFYPDCPKSELFAKMLNVKTLSIDAITILKELGYVVIWK